MCSGSTEILFMRKVVSSREVPVKENVFPFLLNWLTIRFLNFFAIQLQVVNFRLRRALLHDGSFHRGQVSADEGTAEKSKVLAGHQKHLKTNEPLTFNSKTKIATKITYFL